MFSKFQQKMAEYTKRLLKQEPKKSFPEDTCSDHEVTLHDDTTRQLIINGIFDLTMKVIKLWYNDHAQRPHNALFSPINMYLILLLMHPITDGGSCDEIAILLGLPQDDDEKQKTYEMFSQMLQIIQHDHETVTQIVHGIFVQKDCDKLQSYVSQVRTYYEGEIFDVDFYNDPTSATDSINQFILQCTNHKIPTLFETPLQPDTNVVLASSIHFKTRWHKPFLEEETTEENFHTDSGTSPIKLMSQHDYTPYVNLPNLQLEAISLAYAVEKSQNLELDSHGFLHFLPYDKYQLSMFFVLPYRDHTLKDLISSLDASALRQIVDQSESSYMHVRIPKMKNKWTEDTDSSLQELAIVELFNKNAGLDNIIDNMQLKLSQATHAVEIEIDENGSKTIDERVTVTNKEFSDHKAEPILFCVDRPYLIFIYHHVVKTILFMGTVHDPNAPCNGPTSK